MADADEPGHFYNAHVPLFPIAPLTLGAAIGIGSAVARRGGTPALSPRGITDRKIPAATTELLDELNRRTCTRIEEAGNE